jgi:hypothetical protein
MGSCPLAIWREAITPQSAGVYRIHAVRTAQRLVAFVAGACGTNRHLSDVPAGADDVRSWGADRKKLADVQNGAFDPMRHQGLSDHSRFRAAQRTTCRSRPPGVRDRCRLRISTDNLVCPNLRRSCNHSGSESRIRCHSRQIACYQNCGTRYTFRLPRLNRKPGSSAAQRFIYNGRLPLSCLTNVPISCWLKTTPMISS